MLVSKVSFGVDWKRKNVHLYYEDGSSEQINIDENGMGEFLLSMFKAINISSLKGFIEELETVLTHEQKQAIFCMWGASNTIMLSTTSDLLGDRVLAKTILSSGVARGVFGRGVNCTWKFINKEEQKTIKELADRMKRGPIKSPATYKESVETLQTQGFTIGREHEGTKKGVNEGIIVTTDMPKKKVIDSEKSIEVVASSIEEMKEKLAEYKATYYSPLFVESERETKNTLLAKINMLKVEIHNEEVQQSETGKNIGMPGTTSIQKIDDPRLVKKSLLVPVTQTGKVPKKKVT